jgi:hypothetical protein
VVGFTAYFLGNQSVHNAMLLPELSENSLIYA